MRDVLPLVPRPARPLLVVSVLAAAAAACGVRPTAPAVSADQPSPPGAKTVVGAREILIVPSRGRRPTDRIVRLDASLATERAVDVGGADVYGALAAGGGAAALVVPLDAAGAKRPSLVLLDAATLTPRVVAEIPADAAVSPYKSRPRTPFYVGADAPDLVVVPLMTLRPTGATVFDVTLRVVDTARGTWRDVPGPADAVLGALFAAPDRSAHAVVVTRVHEMYDVDLARGVARRVTSAPFLPPRIPGTTPTSLTGLVVRADDASAFVFNRDGETVRVALADGAAAATPLPIEGLGRTAFVDGVAWSAASKLFALTVLRPGDPDNFPSHVVLLDGGLRASGVEFATPSGVMQSMFSPDGDELVVSLLDGSVRRCRASDGATLAASSSDVEAESLLGVR